MHRKGTVVKDGVHRNGSMKVIVMGRGKRIDRA